LRIYRLAVGLVRSVIAGKRQFEYRVSGLMSDVSITHLYYLLFDEVLAHSYSSFSLR
jgi:hypothetical protein